MPCWDLREFDNMAMRFMLGGVLSLPEPHLLLELFFRVLPQLLDKSLRVELFNGVLREQHHQHLPPLPDWLLRLLQLNFLLQLRTFLLPKT